MLAWPTTGLPIGTAYFWAACFTLIVAIVLTVVAHTRKAGVERDLEQERARRQRAETELAEVRSDLDARVLQRTQALEARNHELMQLRLAAETTNQRLRRLVSVDSLTGIANRRHFDHALDREVRRARRDARPLSLIFLDLDEFKGFNDNYGHARGDEVLRKVAQTLNETFRRGGDFVARYGGEEFAVVLPDVDARRAALYAERLRHRIWRLAIPYDASTSTDRVTISGGVATIAPAMAATPQELLRAADKALYRAKCQGRNQIASAAVEIEDAASAARLGMAS